jgi:beta-lactamase class A
LNSGPLKTKIEKYITQAKRENKVTRTSVYFRDLQNGPIINIDAYEDYYGGSLLKVPIMLYYLKKTESDKRLLDTSIAVDESIPESQLEDTEKTVKVGQSYTVRELLEKMIIHSDNAAKNALIKAAPTLIGKEKSLENVYSDLGFDDEANETGVLSLQEYATIFTIIYNSQYLSQQMSQEALNILSRTAFDRGIAAGVPTKITVANKFGIPVITSNPRQLHDCGIIYHNTFPYILCIFTEGDDPLEMEDIMSRISQMVYEEVDKR